MVLIVTYLIRYILILYTIYLVKYVILIYDFIYFDGNHTRIATLEYFESSLSSINNNSVLLFDDIHWNKEMELAWQDIKNHTQVTVTIDTYQWGFVFFRKEQQKEHFIIRL